MQECQPWVLCCLCSFRSHVVTVSNYYLFVFSALARVEKFYPVNRPVESSFFTSMGERHGETQC